MCNYFQALFQTIDHLFNQEMFLLNIEPSYNIPAYKDHKNKQCTGVSYADHCKLTESCAQARILSEDIGGLYCTFQLSLGDI